MLFLVSLKLENISINDKAIQECYLGAKTKIGRCGEMSHRVAPHHRFSARSRAFNYFGVPYHKELNTTGIDPELRQCGGSYEKPQPDLAKALENILPLGVKGASVLHEKFCHRDRGYRRCLLA